ncbi:hypothetical protein ACFS7Z_22830 [Pontibacter toksunensis]|uniref:Uncharacterized protein n=2 Tax=Pontibacter toksunensis TaxID=1332631 RepID=A0ABW6C0A3_9BACT
MTKQELEARMPDVAAELTERVQHRLVSIKPHVSIYNNSTGYWVEFEIQSESASGVLLTSYDFISHVNFEKRTIRGLMKVPSIKCLR